MLRNHRRVRTSDRAVRPSGTLRRPVLVAVALLALFAAALAVRASWVRRHRPRGAPQPAAFYYWKTQWTASPAIARCLAENRVARLYMRFFDVDWEEPLRAAVPVAPLSLDGPLPADTEIIPVVFLTNQVFRNTPYAEVEALADRVEAKIRAMAEASGITPREVQLDCDWSDATRTRYFHFLDRIGTHLHARRIRLSSTLRLHQIKYPQRTGVPPVDRGMLMFYNFGALRADAPRSSIFNVQDAERYAPYIASYSLPLDLALPLFSWTVHSRDGNVLGLIEKLEAHEIEGAGFRSLSPRQYQADHSFFFRGRYFMEGDQLLLEETTPAVTLQAALTAARGATARKPYGTIAFFDLDERNLRHYAASDFLSILAALR